MAQTFIRDCPMCGEKPGEEGVMVIAENMLDPKDLSQEVNIGYTVRCVGCGASVSEEYLTDTISLWNGIPALVKASEVKP